MAGVLGTNVPSSIAPYDDGDDYPTHDEMYGAGGYRTVANNTARDAIPAKRRKKGMLVRTASTGKIWRYTGDDLTASNGAAWENWIDAILTGPILPANGAEGGQFWLARPPADTHLAADVKHKIVGDKLYVYEDGGAARGYTVDLTWLAAGAASEAEFRSAKRFKLSRYMNRYATAELALNAAVADLNAAGNHTVLEIDVPVGTVTTTKTITASFCAIIGHGQASKITYSQTATGLFTFTGSQILVRGLFLQGPTGYASTAGIVLNFDGAGHYIVDCCVFNGGYDLIYFAGGETFLTNCEAFDFKHHYVRYSDTFGGQGRVVNVRAGCDGDNNTGTGFILRSGDTHQFFGVDCTSMFRGVDAASPTGATLVNVDMVACNMDGVNRTPGGGVGDGYSFFGDGGTLARVTLVRCWGSVFPGNGIRIIGVDDYHLIGCRFLANQKEGGVIAGSPTPTYGLIDGCVFAGNSLNNTGTYDDLYIGDYVNYLTIRGGVYGATALIPVRSRYAINIAGSHSDHFRINPDWVTAGGTGAINNAAGVSATKIVQFEANVLRTDYQQTLNSTQQGNAIGALGLRDVALFVDADQTFDATEQLQAIENLGLGAVFPRVDEAQTFDTTEQLQVLDNVGALDLFPRNDTSQSFNTTQQAQLLANLGLILPTAFTPVLTGSTTNPATVGTCTGFKMVIGDWVWCEMNLIITDRTGGAGEILATLPYYCRSGADVSAVWVERGTHGRMGQAFITGGTNVIKLRNQDNSTTNDGTSASLWVSGGVYKLQFAYLK